MTIISSQDVVSFNNQYLYIILTIFSIFFSCSFIGSDLGGLGAGVLYFFFLLFFTGVFSATVFSVNQGIAMICYTSLSILAIQLPIIGFFLGLYGDLNIPDVKIIIGLRPLLMSSLLLLLFFKYIPCLNNFHKCIVIFFIFSMFVSFLISSSTVVDSGKYLINSYIPLFFGFFLV